MATPASLLTMSPLQRLLAGGLIASACIAAMPARAQVVEGAGLQPDGAWSRWQGRIGLAVGEPAGPAWGEGALRPRPALTLLGDYYLLQQGSALPGSYSGGLRATGGLLVGARAQPWGWAPSGAATLHTGYSSLRRSFSLLQGARPIDGDVLPESLPYFGLGYTGLRSLQDGGWGFSADLGVVALRPRSVVRLGQQSVTDLLRDLQLSPMLQLGVSYSF